MTLLILLVMLKGQLHYALKPMPTMDVCLEIAKQAQENGPRNLVASCVNVPQDEV